MSTYLRWKDGESRTGRRFPVKTIDHPTAYNHCPACDDIFLGRETTLVVLGPGDDADLQERHRDGRWYSAVAIEVHADCVGLPPDEPAA